MKLIDKYLLRTVMVPLGYCLTAFVLVYIIYDLFDNLSDFIDAKTPFFDVVLFYLFLLPSVLIYIVPVSLMLAVLYGLSQLTKNNELTAIRAGGVSIFRLMVPAISLGLFFSMLVAVINETIGPWSAFWTHQFITVQQKRGDVSVYVAPNLAFKNEVSRRIWMIDEFNKQTFEMKNVNVIQQRTDGSDEMKVQAREAYWMDGRWWFNDVVMQHYKPNGDPDPTKPSEFALHREMTDFDETPQIFINEIKDPELLSSLELFNFLKTHDHLSTETTCRIKVDLYSRLAMPWTCLVVTLIGIPFGSQTGRKGALLGIVLALLLFFGFYVLVNVCLAMGKKEVLDPWLAGWFPNIFFFVVGSVMIYRMR